MIHLLITLGEERREVQIETSDLTIGRSSENAVPLPDNRLSRRHARIEQDELGFRVKDLNSESLKVPIRLGQPEDKANEGSR